MSKSLDTSIRTKLYRTLLDRVDDALSRALNNRPKTMGEYLDIVSDAVDKVMADVDSNFANVPSLDDYRNMPFDPPKKVRTPRLARRSTKGRGRRSISQTETTT